MMQASKLHLVLFGLALLVGAEARMLNKKSVAKVPNTEKVTLGEATYVGSDIEYNACNPFDPRRYKTVNVCGMATQLKIFLRNRCEGYYQYTEIVGQCSTTTSCQEVDMVKEHWLSAAQSYIIEPCSPR